MADEPSPPAQPVLPAAPWWESPVQVNLVIAGGMQILSILLRSLPLMGIHFQVEDATLDQIGANITQGVAALFGIVAIVKRQRSSIQPLTMSKGGAATQNAANPSIVPAPPKANP